MDGRLDGDGDMPAIGGVAESERRVGVIGQFIADHCELGPDLMAPAGDLFRAFQQELPNSRVSQHSFGGRLRERGFEKGRTNKGKHGWKGLRLLNDGVVATIAAGFKPALNAKKGVK